MSTSPELIAKLEAASFAVRQSYEDMLTSISKRCRHDNPMFGILVATDDAAKDYQQADKNMRVATKNLNKLIAILKCRTEQMEAKLRISDEGIQDWIARHAKLLVKLENAKLDKERMDWCEANTGGKRLSISRRQDDGAWQVAISAPGCDESLNYPNMRAAIDAARQCKNE